MFQLYFYYLWPIIIYSLTSTFAMHKTVIITGASSGIGKACALLFLKENYNVVLAARNIEAMKKIVSPYSSTQYLIVKTDVSIAEDCKNVVKKTIEKFSTIDILINNAGISMRSLFDGMNLESFKQLMDINFWGTVYCTHAALPYIRKSKGSIVGVSSIAGYRGLPARTGYSASKFAMNGFLESLRTEELYSGIHVLTACPGFTASNIRKRALTSDGSTQNDSPRDEHKMMTAEQVASFLFKAIKKRKRTLILTKQGKLTVFLSKFFPKLLDKLVYNHMAKEENSPFK